MEKFCLVSDRKPWRDSFSEELDFSQVLFTSGYSVVLGSGVGGVTSHLCRIIALHSWTGDLSKPLCPHL